MRASYRLRIGIGLLSVIAGAAFGQSAPSTASGPPPTDPSIKLAQVVVIGTSPLPGTNIDVDKVPGNVETLSAADLSKDGTPNLLGSMETQLSSVNINDTMADPYQPDLLVRGFEASPVLGTPQGLAVYQNGVRINEAFGDAVNWDFFPDIAIDRVDIVSSNPVYGLNALGGAVSVTMKNGFTYKGGDVEYSLGSFAQRSGEAQLGASNDNFGIYVAARDLNMNGWREFAADKLRQFYSDASFRNDGWSFDVTYTHADNRLFGQGAAPVQSLAISTENVFTGPQDNLNRLDFITLNGSWAATDTLSLQSVIYYRHYTQTVANGNTTDYEECMPPQNTKIMCQSDGLTAVHDSEGADIPDLTDGGTLFIGENDEELIGSQTVGGSLQMSDKQSLFGHDNQFTAGSSADIGHVNFLTTTQLGVVNSQLTVLPSPYFVTTPESSPFGGSPTHLIADNTYYGFYATDTFDASPDLSITASGRYNVAILDLFDQLGTNLNGENRYTHFNPALGATYKITPAVTAYAGYSQTNRAPDASEIECSNPLLPCLLPTNLAGDPPTLKQVIAHTFEAGLRGRFTLPSDATAQFTWSASAFRTNLDDDIYGIATSVSTGFFQNIGQTRREGFEGNFNYLAPRWSAYLNYTYIDATFQSALLLNSPQNPFADVNGNIQVEPGDHLPLIPEHRLKLGADFAVLPNWTVGGAFVFVSDSFYKGDESNQNTELPGYHVFNLHTTVHITKRFDVFATVDNVFNERYATFGIYSDPTGVGAPGIPRGAVTNGPGVDNRFQSPAMPFAVFGGVRLNF
jgi:iron complex outermembrane receptor protein